MGKLFQNELYETLKFDYIDKCHMQKAEYVGENEIEYYLGLRNTNWSLII